MIADKPDDKDSGSAGGMPPMGGGMPGMGGMGM